MKFGKTFPNHQVPEWSHKYVNYKALKKVIKEITSLQGDLYKQKHKNDVRNGDNPVSVKRRDTSNVEERYLNHPEVKKLLASFFFALDRDIEKVDNFYNMEFMEYDRRLRKLLSSPQFTDLTSLPLMGTHINSSVTNYGVIQQPVPHVGSYTCNVAGNGIGRATDYSHVDQVYVQANPTEESDTLAEVLNILIELRSHFRNLKWYGELNKRAFTKILKKLDKKAGSNQQHSYLQARIMPLDFSNDAEVVKDLSVINEILDRISPRVRDLQARLRNDDKRIFKDSTSPIDSLSQLIEKDDGAGLINELTSIYRSVVLIPTRVLVTILNKSALSQSFKCVDEVLEIIPTLGDPSDINSRNFFHHHVIALGKKHKSILEHRNDLNSLLTDCLDFEAAIPPDTNARLLGAFGPDGVNSDDSPASLSHILQQLPAHLRPSLLQRDNYKRTPLHYSAQFGLVEVTRIIIEYLKEWGAWNADIAIDDVQTWGDSEGFTPLHLAVIGTHALTVTTMVSFMSPGKSVKTPRLLHLATRLNSPALIDSLLSVNGFDINHQDAETSETPLYVACKLDLYEAAKALIKRGANMEIGEKLFGWTPIFIAVTEGYARIVKLLIDNGAKHDIFDESGWTPMEHAALRGHLEIAEMVKITNNKAITRPKFASNWSTPTKPGDSITLLSASTNTSESTLGSDARGISLSPNNSNEFYKLRVTSSSSIDKISESNKGKQKKLLKSQLSSGKIPTVKDNNLPQPVKSFGHNFLQKNESVIMVTLGTNDSRTKIPVVSLNRVPVSKVSSTELDTALSLMVTCKEDLDQQPVILDLPLDENLDSINFKVPHKHDSSYVIFFDIVPTYGYALSDKCNKADKNVQLSNSNNNGSTQTEYQMDLAAKHPSEHINRTGAYLQQGSQLCQETPQNKQGSKILGRAVAFLDSATKAVGTNKCSIAETIVVPIIGSDSLEILGTVCFNFLIATPFLHRNLSLGPAETYWKSLVSTRVIGHRGLGKNMNTKKSLQLGENTIESFIAAASLGASYVEFDVQLTKDSIPVVYHDFLVAESGVDIPMHELTLEQFLNLSNADRHNGQLRNSANKPGAGNSRNPSRRRLSMDDSSAEAIKRSLMMLGEDEETDNDLTTIYRDRMRLTRTFKKTAFKANSRGHAIASNFATLEELFKKIPQNVGFNIECKYPMVDEAEEEHISPVAIELNHWVDTVLQVVYENAGGRDVIFSSFQPNICIMLSLKQPSFPILFLTEGGKVRRCDMRAASLQNAIRLAHRWNLLGIVSAADPIVIAPRLAQIVKSSGLVCVTYGVQNNDPETARIEMDAGVDAVIVDSVLAVRKGLTKNADDLEEETTDSTNV
ncbi:glycerophosphocholine phosphodiesterase Ecym_7094 [Eremothecium cymbalariae DBVPG|uniref:Uncharacterized protein n=1 Tax=Eremothecium cymbalariae (strain CBS 270.75 / DBVPG 7215 / KCTC 17166 / NRRL Y-17582) TaxID=931890 RepID=G8JVT1_ERECY|nr:hypothetical protein Ecym_7094 [Eremothecium cymbalariae DBVPG\